MMFVKAARAAMRHKEGQERADRGIRAATGFRRTAMIMSGPAQPVFGARLGRHLPSAARGGAALAFALMASATAATAAPRLLDCSLTTIERKAGRNSDFADENRLIRIMFDQEAKALAIYQGGQTRALQHVTISQSAMNGYDSNVSLGIDPSSWSIVLQSYAPDAMNVEFGACTPGAEPPS